MAWTSHRLSCRTSDRTDIDEPGVTEALRSIADDHAYPGDHGPICCGCRGELLICVDTPYKVATGTPTT